MSTDLATSTTQQTGTKVDYLTEDKNVPSGQRFVCVSFLSPEGVRNCTIRGLKIRGVFGDEPSARKFAADLQQEDPLFHIFVGEMGKWLPWDQDPNTVKDQNYAEEELQKLMKAKVANSEKAKVAEKQRRDDIKQKSIAEVRKHKKESVRERLRRTHDDKEAAKEVTKNRPVSGNVDPVVQEKERVAQQERDRLAANESVINQEETNVKTIDANINKIKEIYENMQKKKATAATASL